MTSREIVLNGTLAVLILSVAVVILFRYGPIPHSQSEEEVSNVSARVQRNPDPIDAADTEDASLSIIGLMGRKSGKGHVSSTAVDYIGSLEAMYVGRGYRQFSELRKQRSHMSGVYWRNNFNDFCMILAIGNNANPADGQELTHVQTYLTVAKERDGGTDWSSFLFPQMEPGKVASENDLFGDDPAGIPRSDKVRRLFGFREDVSSAGSLTVYSSEVDPAGLSGWYRTAMSPAWKSDDISALEAGQGMMMFSQNGRRCLIWICDGDQGGSFVVISVHDQ